MIIETGSITGTRARTNNKGINDGLTDMTAPEDFNESTTEAMTDVTMKTKARRRKEERDLGGRQRR